MATVITASGTGIYVPAHDLHQGTFIFKAIDDDLNDIGTITGLDANVRWDSLGNSKGGTVQAIQGISWIPQRVLLKMIFKYKTGEEQTLWAGIFKDIIWTNNKARLEFMGLHEPYIEDSYELAGYPKIAGLTLGQKTYGVPSAGIEYSRLDTAGSVYQKKWNYKPTHSFGITALNWDFQQGYPDAIPSANVPQLDVNNHVFVDVKSRGHDSFGAVTRWGSDAGKEWVLQSASRSVARFQKRRVKSVSLKPSKYEVLNTNPPQTHDSTGGFYYEAPIDETFDVNNHQVLGHFIFPIQSYLLGAADIDNNPSSPISNYKPKSLTFPYEIHLPSMPVFKDTDSPTDGLYDEGQGVGVSTLVALSKNNTWDIGQTHIREHDGGLSFYQLDVENNSNVKLIQASNATYKGSNDNSLVSIIRGNIEINNKLLTDYNALQGFSHLIVWIYIEGEVHAWNGALNVRFIMPKPELVEERLNTNLIKPPEAYKPIVGDEAFELKTNGLIIPPAKVVNLPNGQAEFVTASEMQLVHGSRTASPTISTRISTTSSRY